MLHHTNSDIIPQKSTVHLTDRQLKYIALRSSGKSRAESVKLAGYNDNVAPAKVESSPNLRKALIDALEVNGLTSEYLGKKLKEGVNAKKIYFTSFKGSIVDEREIPDNETQHKYVRTALEVRGDLQSDPSVNVNIGLIESPKIESNPESWNDVSTQNP